MEVSPEYFGSPEEEEDLILTGVALEGFLEEVTPEERRLVWKPQQAFRPGQVDIMGERGDTLEDFWSLRGG